LPIWLAWCIEKFMSAEMD